MRAVSWIPLLAEVFLSAEPFPAGPPVPGYASVRVHLVASESSARGTLRLRTSTGSATEMDVEVPGGGSRDLVLSVWRTDDRPIEVSFASQERRVDPGPPRSIVLAVGGLAEAEAASDLFRCALTEVLRTSDVPEMPDPMALDGFAGVVPRDLPAGHLLGYKARGGALRGPRSAPRAPVVAAAALPARGLLPRDLFGPWSAPIRCLLAGSIAAAALSLLVTRRPAVALAFAGFVALATTALIETLASGRAAGLVIELGEEAPALLLQQAGGTGSMRGNGALFPCGRDSRLIRRLDVGGTTWSGAESVLLARLSPPGATAAAEPVDPADLPGRVARTAALAAAEIAGPGARVAHDATNGRLLLRARAR
jgi:hypothetical protein